MSILEKLKELLVNPLPGDVSAAFGPGDMREDHVLCMGPHGLHKMAYVEWGEIDNPRVLVCVHGLTRTGRDFDVIANALAREYRVVCPDVVGRGRSDRLRLSDDYSVTTYAPDMMVLLARLNVETVHWIGTSMGGLIGMVLASLPDSPITKLVLNDVGPVVPREALERIAEYVGKAPYFATLEDAETYFREVAAPFDPLTDAQWRYLTVVGTRQREDGQFEMAYDPAIAEPFHKAFLAETEINLWPVYEAIRCPTLLLRGENSDVLLRDTAVEMSKRGPKARLVEIRSVGHAPMLMNESQVQVVRDFLLDPAGS
jgi:pimeloyl-ACP methyl ester carboxylesterase